MFTNTENVYAVSPLREEWFRFSINCSRVFVFTVNIFLQFLRPCAKHVYNPELPTRKNILKSICRARNSSLVLVPDPFRRR